MDLVRIFKTVLPAMVVLIAGLVSMKFVYNTYVVDDSATVISLEPAAGTNAGKTVEDTMAIPLAVPQLLPEQHAEIEAKQAAIAAIEQARQTADIASKAISASDFATKTVTNCQAAMDSRTAAVGTENFEMADKTAKECEVQRQTDLQAAAAAEQSKNEAVAAAQKANNAAKAAIEKAENAAKISATVTAAQMAASPSLSSAQGQ